MSNQLAGGAPERIWACPMRDGCGWGPGDEDDPPIWAEGYWDQVQDGSKDENEYILATREAIAKSPEAQALIREAEARVMRIAASLFPGGYDSNFAKITAAAKHREGK